MGHRRFSSPRPTTRKTRHLFTAIRKRTRQQKGKPVGHYCKGG